jgi:hypothetical protein
MASWQEEYKIVTAKVVTALVAAVVVIWIFLLPVFEPNYGLQGKIQDLEVQIRRQAVLLPEQMKLDALLGQEMAEGFDLPKPEPVKISEINVLPPRFVRVALDAGLEVLDVVVSPGSLHMGGGRIKMQCVVFGDMARFQDFYHAIGALPYVENVDKVEMQAVPGGIEFFVEYWVLLDESRG